jgi:AbrB family looped-hinge helix DNA binding protein
MENILSKVVRNYQITIPSKVRKVLNIKEGDLIKFELRDSEVVLIPVSIVKKEQAYFFTKKWQKAIKKSEEEIKKGKFSVYRSSKELEKELEND